MQGTVEFSVVDAFTPRPFAGNTAGVCLLDGPAAGGWMQAVAREVNFSETAFVHQEGSGYGLRWFTPVAEIELCGHATLASAHMLWEEGRLTAGETARFHTLSGELTAARDVAEPDWIVLDFPAIPTQPADPPAGLLEALRLSHAVHVGRAGDDLLVQLETASEVRALRPEFSRLLDVDARTVAVTAPASEHEAAEDELSAHATVEGRRSSHPADGGTVGDPDIVTRFFAPRVGVTEDPVTGYAHCMVGPYWQRVWGRSDFLAYQASQRGGYLRVKVRGDRVHLGGQAVTVIRGRILEGPTG